MDAQIIESASNPLIVAAAKLKEKKFRKLNLKFLVEGEKMILEALAMGLKFESIFTSDEKFLSLSGGKVYLTSDRAMKKLSDTVTPQGIIGVMKIEPNTVGDFDRCVILDNVQDAGNLGTIIRTCAAVGIEDIFLQSCADAYNPKTIRSSMSGIYHVRLHEMQTADIIDCVKKRGIPLLCGDMSGDDVFSVSMDRFALVVGNEAHGISTEFFKAADRRISLKMKNIESLNVSVALSVMLYKLVN